MGQDADVKQAVTPFRSVKGRFMPGNPGPPPDKRRKKGQPNKINRAMKDIMTGAAT